MKLILGFFLFFSQAALAGKFDFSLCNDSFLESLVPPGSKKETQPFFEILPSGRLEIRKNHPRSQLISASHGKKKDEIVFYEFREAANSLQAASGSRESVSNTSVILHREYDRPSSLVIRRKWIRADQLSKREGTDANGWEALKKKLKKRKSKEFSGGEISQWATLGYTGNRCYVREDGFFTGSQEIVAFDHALCAHILRVSDRKAATLISDWKSPNPQIRAEVRRILQLIRGEIVTKNENLQKKGRKLMAAGVAPPENSLPGALSEEEASALRELQQCENRKALEDSPMVIRGQETMDELRAPPDASE